MNRIRLLQGFTLFSSTVLALGAQTTSDPGGGLAGPASSGPLPTATATIDLASDTSFTSRSATAPAGLAPTHFSNVILTQTPGNATGSGGVSTIFSSAGSQFTFGSGGRLVDPADFQYEVTGANTATLTVPAEDGSAAATTELLFTGENTGTYTSVTGDTTTSGTFGLSTIPAAAPLANISARTTVTGNNHAIIGFVIAGNAPRRVLVRAVGPGLANFGVTPALQNPTLKLYRGLQMIATNDSWSRLLPLPTVSANTADTNRTDATSTPSPGTTETDPAGTGSGSSDDSAGPGATGSGATGGTLFTGTFPEGETFTTELATANQFTAVGAFGLDDDSEDAAFVATLPPGAYTVVVSRSNPAGIVGAPDSDISGSGSDNQGNGSGNRATGTGGDGEGTGIGTETGAAGSGEVLVEVYFIE